MRVEADYQRRPLETPLATEAKCRRCGRCCHQKLRIGDRMIYLDTPCRHLDVDTNLCRVYERRHEVNPECLTVEEGVRRGVFPADCLYVEGLPGYRAPVENPGPEAIADALAALEEAEIDS